MRIKWLGARFQSQVEGVLQRNLDRAAVYLQGQIKAGLTKGGGKANVERSGARRGSGGRFTKQKRRPRRSRPGEAPLVQTGRLRNSIFWRRGRRGRRDVGTNVGYGVAHELGINYSKVGFQQRPFIRPVFNRVRGVLGRIILTGR